MSMFDILVIGGGHAGIEAAHAGARMGARTCLLTLSECDLGALSCNPAFGGVGKGHLVREIDAMDGVMGRLADCAGIHFRLLNRRKGPAVQGPRVQTDHALYRRAARGAARACRNLILITGEAVDFRIEGQRVAGCVLAGGEQIAARKTILTAGTFLRGKILIGQEVIAGGRLGNRSASRLGARLDALGLRPSRLKTGTPPRLDAGTIDWDILEEQPGDAEPTMMSFLSQNPTQKQIACAITHTNLKTHEIIHQNLGKSAIYGGFIDSQGPRYCPSIEDKVVRFADRHRHQIFLERESHTNQRVYPNGISTSLPVDVQLEMVRSIRGLADAKIVQPGYAIEYDFFDPCNLTPELRVPQLPGLYLAGQINGTTGYEEAGAQGLVAGLNAAAEIFERPPVRFSRHDSYIGVMIDDLVSRGVKEPYRMFTSRAEYRLRLRADNADQRLTRRGIEIGCVRARRKKVFEQKAGWLAQGRAQIEARHYSPHVLQHLGINLNLDGNRRTGQQALALPGMTLDCLARIDPTLANYPPGIALQLENDARYVHHIERQEEEISRLERDANVEIPDDFDYEAISGLSHELTGKLMRTRPLNLAQAARLDGMTPAALVLIAGRLAHNAGRPEPAERPMEGKASGEGGRAYRSITQVADVNTSLPSEHRGTRGKQRVLMSFAKSR